MKKVTMIMSLLLTLGMFSACNSNDELDVLLDEKLTLFEDSLQYVPEEEYTGSLYYDYHYGWTIVPPGTYIDYGGAYYLPVNLPDEFKTNKEGSVKVSYTGKVIKMSDEEIEKANLWRYDGKESFYFVYLTNIEEAEIPYRGNPPFTITDVPGMVSVNVDTQEWFILYWSSAFGCYVNAYYPTEMGDEFKVSGGYMHVNISGNVFEEYPERNAGGIKAYKIELTKIEKVE